MTSEDDEILAILRAQGSGEPVTDLRRAHTSLCPHRLITVDLSARKVTCGQCTAELDPITALDQLGREQDRWRAAASLASQHSTKVLELQAELRRLRARIKSLKAQSALPALDHAPKRARKERSA